MWNFIVSWYSFWIPVSAVCWMVYGLLHLLIFLNRGDGKNSDSKI